MTAAAPSGVVTFLFTDVEGSTRRWETDAGAMRAALAAHDKVLHSAIETHGGWLFKHTGDGVCATFESPRSAVAAQRALELPVRMGMATGEAERSLPPRDRFHIRRQDHRPFRTPRSERILDAESFKTHFCIQSLRSAIMAESTEKKTAAELASDLTERAAGLSDEVLKSVESGQRAAIDAVRKFVGAVDESMPAHGDDHPSRRNTIVDAALDMADKLVETQYEFIRSVVSSASETLKKQGDGKPGAD